MKYHLSAVLFLFCLINSSNAQVGFKLGFSNIQAQGWEEILDSQPSSVFLDSRTLNEGIHFAVDYRIKHPSLGIYFSPSIGYYRFIRVLYTDFESTTGEITLDIFQIALSSKIHFLDLNRKKDETLYNNKAPLIYKGLFAEVSAAANLFRNNYQYMGRGSKGKDINFGTAIGMGLDLPISSTLTISPFLKYHLIFQAHWKDFDKVAIGKQYNNGEDNSTEVYLFELGIRFGLGS